MKSTNKILVVGLILMVALNICTLGYIVFFKPSFDHFPPKGRRMDRGELLKKKLHFTETQGKKLDSIRKDHEEKMLVIREKKDAIRKEISALLKKDPFDAAKLDLLATEIGKYHKEMEVQMTLYFVSVKRLCTTDQIEYFNEFIDRMAERKQMWKERFGPWTKDRKQHQEF